MSRSSSVLNTSCIIWDFFSFSASKPLQEDSKLTGKELGITRDLREVKTCLVHVIRVEIGAWFENIPLLKNLSWLLFPTMIRAPPPPFLSADAFAVRHCSRQCLSTASSAGLSPDSTRASVRRLSAPLCNSMTQTECFAGYRH